MAQLITAASRHEVGTEALVRAALLVAMSMNDDSMCEWCRLELNGYPGGPGCNMPAYRVTTAVLMATNAMGEDVPAQFRDPEVMKEISRCTVFKPVAELQQYVAFEGNQLTVLFSAEYAAKLRKRFPGCSEVFRVVQKTSFNALLAAVRQRVFDWALSRSGEGVTLPPGLSLEAVLGRAGTGATPVPVPVSGPVIATESMRVTLSDITGSTVIIAAPGASATTHYREGSVDAIKALAAALAEALAEAAKAGQPSKTLEPLEKSLQELEALCQIEEPRAAWMSQAAASLWGSLEGGAGTALTKPAKLKLHALLDYVSKALHT